MLIDITLQKRAENSLITLNQNLERQIEERTAQIKDNLARYKAVLNAATDAIIVINGEGIIESVNPATEVMFGYPDKDLLGKSISLIIPNHHVMAHADNVNSYLEKSENDKSHIVGKATDLFAKRKDGMFFPVSFSVNKVDNEDRFTGIVRDMSDRVELEKELLQRVEEERSRISRELHDSVAQVIIGIGMRLKALSLNLMKNKYTDPEELDHVSGAMGRMSTELEALGREIRTIVANLSSLDLDKADLIDALTGLVDTCQTYTASDISLDLPEKVILNDARVVTQLFRIAQEALHNAIKHANGSDTRIELRQSKTDIRLSVIDNGVGSNSIQTDTHPIFKLSGKGLDNMKYRANIIGATLEITSVAGSGTRIDCILPTQP